MAMVQVTAGLTYSAVSSHRRAYSRPFRTGAHVAVYFESTGNRCCCDVRDSRAASRSHAPSEMPEQWARLIFQFRNCRTLSREQQHCEMAGQKTVYEGNWYPDAAVQASVFRPTMSAA